MIQVIGIGGEPATGKSTLVAALLHQLGERIEFKFKQVAALSFPSAKVLVLGVYDGSTFQGTDRLSMSVQPIALKLLQKLHSSPGYDGWTVLFEGDRLFNSSFIESIAASQIPGRFYALQVGDDTKHLRHQQRGDTQGQSWLQSRKTKLKNILDTHPHIKILSNETVVEQAQILRSIIEAISSFCALL